MKTKRYFVNGNGENHLAISGRYGEYCKIKGINYSVKEMQKLGFEIQDLTSEQAKDLSEKFAAWKCEAAAAEHEHEMQERKRCVEICLNCDPLEIGEGNHLWNHITDISEEMGEAYHGCGKGTAYISDGKIIAFHYGYSHPDNAPEAEAIQVEFSSYQILF